MRPAITAAGHYGAQQGEGLFIKPSSEQEISFYQNLISEQSPLYAYVPQFMGTLVEKTPNKEAVTQPFLVLEDICAGFTQPSIMDVKLGKQLWDNNTPEEKRLRLQRVADSTTTGSLGFRIAGLNSINAEGVREKIGKEFGRKANKDDITEYLKVFWPNLSNEYVMDGCVAGIIAKLEELQSVLRGSNLKFHSASVLIIYEGNLEVLIDTVDGIMRSEDENPRSLVHTTPNAQSVRLDVAEKTEHHFLKNDEGNDESNDQISISDEESICEDDEDESFESEAKILDVRLIDFAHSSKSSSPDNDVIEGLGNLIASLCRINGAHCE